MKSFLVSLFLAAAVIASAQTSTSSGSVVQALDVSASNFSIDWTIEWSCDDYPQSSAPGRIELRDSGGNLVARLSGSVYRDSGPSVTVGAGSVANVAHSIFRYAADGAPADGSLQGTWNLTGLTPGQYTLRLFGYTTWGNRRNGTAVWTSSSVSATYPTPGGNTAPTIEWFSAPANAENGQSYTISARGRDADGNLTQVNVWKSGQPFAFAGGGNGFEGHSGNPTSDSGPQTVTFTAQAVDAAGATSSLLTHVVTINPPANTPPSVTLLSPGAQTVTAGTTLTLTARATDADGNLSGHNLDIQRPAGDWNFQGGFAIGEPYQGGPVGSGYDSTRSASYTFTDVGTYQVRSGAYDGSGWYHSATVAITVTPANRAPTIEWVSAPANVTHQQSYTVTARGSDADENLVQVDVWKNGLAFASAGGGNGFNGEAGGATSDSGATTVTFTAQARDAAGATSAIITHTVSVAAPPPAQYTLVTRAGAGGQVTAGGVFTEGTVVTVSAMPGANYEFNGWSGDASGMINPVSVLVDRDKTVQANFSLKQFALTTSATSGGSVTPGGTYTYGSIVTLTAVADATSRFVGWSGDASGTGPSVAVTMTEPRLVQANFATKDSQTITFVDPGSRAVDAPPFSLQASASSGLPVTFVVLSGPAVIEGNQLRVTGAGPVSVQANQSGDASYLPATAVTRTFNAVAAAVVTFRRTGRTLLLSRSGQTATNVVIETP